MLEGLIDDLQYLDLKHVLAHDDENNDFGMTQI